MHKNGNENGRIPRNILLIENNEIISTFYTQQLKNYGYGVISALSSKRAIDTLNAKQTDIDLVLMDYDLISGPNDSESAEIILRNDKMPVLILSDHNQMELNEYKPRKTHGEYVSKNSGMSVLDASIKKTFKLHAMNNYPQVKRKEVIPTKRTSIENRYQKMFESAREGILLVNSDNGIIGEVNPYLIKMSGYSKNQLLHKKMWKTGIFKNPESAKALFDKFRENEQVHFNDLALKTKDGIEINVEITGNAYHVDGKRLIQWNIRDISEHRQVINQLSNEIEKKDTMLRELQHRAKNSFNLITGLIDLRSTTIQSDETKQVLKELSLRVKSISDLYSMLYDNEAYDDVELNKYCDTVIESIHNMAKDIVISKEIENVTTSAKKAATIGMILVELLFNAVKYAFPHSGKGRVDVKLKQTGSNVLLTVSDNGVGLPEDFDISESDSSGLRLVELMATQLNGSTSFRSNHGTEVTVEFKP